MDEWMMSSQLRGRKIAFEWMSLSRLCLFYFVLFYFTTCLLPRIPSYCDYSSYATAIWTTSILFYSIAILLF